MKSYVIRMPFTGVASLTVYAESEKEALDKFYSEASFPDMSKSLSTDVEVEDIDFAQKIVGGNVFYGIQNEYEIEEN